MISEDTEQRTIEEAWAISSYKEAIETRKANKQAWINHLRNQARTFRSLAEDYEDRAERVAATSVDEGLDLKLAPGRAERW